MRLLDYSIRFVALLAIALVTFAGHVAADPAATSLTIYNQDFAVVRQPIDLNLTAGDNHVTVTDVTSELEPDSVVLRDPTGSRTLQIFEQNYLADPVSEQRLLEESVGKTIEFEMHDGTVVMGKVIRAGTALGSNGSDASSGTNYAYRPRHIVRGPQSQFATAIVEVNGKLQFGLPGEPHFDSLGADPILKPTLDWILTSDKPGPLPAELSYITAGLKWSASYNLVEPASGGPLELTALVTMTNHCGKDFPAAQIKLMAGDISKLAPQNSKIIDRFAVSKLAALPMGFPAVTEQTFDEYHLYTLQHATSLRDGETKQVEFAHSKSVDAVTTYSYDGLYIDPDQYGDPDNYYQYRGQRDFGTQCNTKVSITREFKNDAASGLGIALPKGDARLYRRDADGRLEFLGEDEIDHTPTNELVKLNTGNAFDIVGERTQTDYQDQYKGPGQSSTDESFKITLRNHKATDATVRVVEHLYRAANWAITANSDDFQKTDANTIEFMVDVPAGGSKTVTYTAHYTW